MKNTLRGEGLTRIAVKHFGARPSIHPNINRFSVTLRLSISEPGRAFRSPAWHTSKHQPFQCQLAV